MLNDVNVASGFDIFFFNFTHLPVWPSGAKQRGNATDSEYQGHAMADILVRERKSRLTAESFKYDKLPMIRPMIVVKTEETLAVG